MFQPRHCVVAICLLSAGLARTAADDKPIISAESALPVIDWTDAGKYLDREVIVQGKIVVTRNIGKICFLNFDTARSFTAIVHERNYKNFPKPPERLYDHRIVRIRGLITVYRGKPQIEVVRPDQVEMLDAAGPVTSQPSAPRPAFDGVVTIATHNVLNMFDSYDCPYHSDEGTAAKPKAQLEALAKTIRLLDADVLALQEIENRGYLERFVAAYLGDMGYEHVVCVESNDRRGIDCAVLSRLPVGPVTSYRHQRFPDGAGETMWFRRDLLAVQIEPVGYPAFTVFTVHFKSKRGGGNSTERYRIGEARQARRVLDGLLSRDAKALFVICGDFNDTWESAPLKALRGEGATALRSFLGDLPPGTDTYNKRPGGMIDFVLASPTMAGCYVAKSCRVIPGSVASLGSDHNPVSVRFDLTSLD